MIALLQRVVGASIDVAGQRVASIGPGLLVLVAVRPADDEASALRLITRLLQYRVFADAADKMNLSLTQPRAICCWCRNSPWPRIPQGAAPRLLTAAPPEQGRYLFDALVQAAASSIRASKRAYSAPICGCRLTNDGPVTFWLES